MAWTGKLPKLSGAQDSPVTFLDRKDPQSLAIYYTIKFPGCLDAQKGSFLGWVFKASDGSNHIIITYI